MAEEAEFKDNIDELVWEPVNIEADMATKNGSASAEFKDNIDELVWEPVNTPNYTTLDADTGEVYSVPATMDETDTRFAIATQHENMSPAAFIGKMAIPFIADAIKQKAEDRIGYKLDNIKKTPGAAAAGVYDISTSSWQGQIDRSIDYYAITEFAEKGRLEKSLPPLKGVLSKALPDEVSAAVDEAGEAIRKVVDMENSTKGKPWVQKLEARLTGRAVYTPEEIKEARDNAQELAGKAVKLVDDWRKMNKERWEKKSYELYPKEARGKKDLPDLFYGVANGATSIGGTMAATLITKNPAVAAVWMGKTFYDTTKSEAFQEAKAMGEDFDAADWHSTMLGVFEGGLEGIGDWLTMGLGKFGQYSGLSKVMKQSFTNAFLRAAGKKGVKPAVTNAIKVVARKSPSWSAAFKGFLAEGPFEETIQNLSSDYYKNAIGWQDKASGDIWSDALWAGFVGGITGFAAAGGGSVLYNRKMQHWNNELKKVIKHENPGISEDDAQQAADLLQESYLQEGMPIINELNNVLAKEKDVDALPEGGLDIKSIGEVTRNLMKEKFGVTDEEIDNWVNIMLPMIDARNQYNEAYQGFYDQLTDAGRDEKMADREARIIAARATTLAIICKQSVGDILNRWKLRIENGDVLIKMPGEDKAILDAENTAVEPATPEELELLQKDIDRLKRGVTARKKAKGIRLAQFIVQNGGIADDRGDIKAMGSMPGLLNKNGISLDEAARMAWDAGYITGTERPDVNQLLDLLSDDLGNRPVYTENDQLKGDNNDYYRSIEQAFDEAGVDIEKDSVEEVDRKLKVYKKRLAAWEQKMRGPEEDILPEDDLPFWQSMYESPLKSFEEFYDDVMKGDNKKARYYTESINGISLDIPTNALGHDDNKHNLTKQEWLGIIKALKKNKILAATLGDYARMNGAPVKMIVDVNGTEYGVTFEHMKNGRNLIQSAFVLEDKGWIRPKQQKSSQTVANKPQPKSSRLGSSLNEIISNLDDNVNTFWQSAVVRDVVSRKVKPEDVKDLYATHNMSLAGVRDALKMGGLAMPSMAMRKIDQGNINQFGDIVFVGNEAIAAPSRSTEVYDRDAWTPNLSFAVRYDLGPKTNKLIRDVLTKAGRPRDASTFRYNIEENITYPTSNTMAMELYELDKGLAKENSTGKYINNQDYLDWYEENITADAEPYLWTENDSNTDMIRRKFTLNNMMKVLRKQENAGGGFIGDYIFDVYKLLNFHSQKFKNLKELKKNKDKLVSREEQHKQLDKLNDDFLALADELKKEGEEYRFGEATYGLGIALIQDNEEQMAYWLNDKNLQSDAAALKKVKDFIERMKNIPTDYFEVKPRRIVNFNEFSGVIIPEGKQYDEVANTLSQQYNLPVERVEKGNEGQYNTALHNIQAQKPTTFFQSAKNTEQDDKNLVMTHSAKIDNIDAIINTGSLIAPSMAITNKNQNILDGFGFGEVIFVRNPNSIDFRRDNIYDRDIYSPRMPAATYKTKMGYVDPYEYESMKREWQYSQEKFKEHHDGKTFDEYFKGAEKVLYKGFTPAGYRRYVPYTANNILAEMKQQGLQNGEHWGYGLSSFLATLGKKQTSMKRLKAVAGDLGKVELEVYDKLREQYDSFESKLREYAQKDYSGSEYFMDIYSDVMRGIATNNMRILNEFLDMKKLQAENPKLLQEARDFVATAVAMKRSYFEAKPMREVQMSEFSAVMVPKEVTEEQKQGLRNLGLNVVEYERGHAGEALKGLHNEVFFQSAYAGSRVDYDIPSLEAIGSGEGAQAHGWGLYYALKKYVAEKYRISFTFDDKINDLVAKHQGLLRSVAMEVYNFGKYNTLKEYKKELNKLKRKKNVDEETEKNILSLENTIESIEAITDEEIDAIRNNKGQVHEVDIPENPYLLDEQKPFSEQSEHVRGVLESLNKDGDAKGFLNTLRTHKDDGTIDGYDIYQKISKYVGGDKAASQLLEKHGIKGITYDGKQDGRCFVIFNPKSVSVIQKFYQMAGPNAKTAALDQLDKAKQLEAQGTDMEEIRQQTGWHKWVDGKWRFEISDKDAKLDILSALIAKAKSNLKALEEILKDNPSEENKQNVADLRKEIKGLRSYEDIANWTNEAGALYSLGDILDHEKLYAAYPELQNMAVRIVNNPNDHNAGTYSIGGFLDPREIGIITLNVAYNKDIKEMRRTLLHEIQHAIQKAEGFASGGSEYTAINFLKSKTHKVESSQEMWDFEELLDKYDMLNDVSNVLRLEKDPESVAKTAWFYERFMGVPKNKKARKEFLDEKGQEFLDYLMAKYRQKSPYKLDQYFEYLEMEKPEIDKMRKSVSAKIDRLHKKIYTKDYAAAKLLLSQYKNNEITAEKLYTMLAGEVEARNTEARSDMSAEDLLATSPESTQDIYNDAAIVVFDDGTQMSYAPAQQQDTMRPQGARGSFTRRADTGEAIIELFETADASTIIHELGHFFLDDMKRFADDPTTAEQLQAIYRYVGSLDGNLSREQHEYFARSFEAYIREGRSPNSTLKRVFAKFRFWLKKIYSEVKLLDVDLDDNIRQVFDEMLGGRQLDFALQRGSQNLQTKLQRGFISAWNINKAMQLLHDGKMSKADMQELINELKAGKMEGKDFGNALKKFEQSNNINKERLTEWDYNYFRTQLDNLNFKRDKVKERIMKLLDWTKPRSRGGKLVGRFPNKYLNDKFDHFRELANMDKDEARAKQQENLKLLEEYTFKGGNINAEQLRFENKLLSLATGRISDDALLELYEALSDSYNEGRLTDKITGEIKKARKERMINEAKEVLTDGGRINWHIEDRGLKAWAQKQFRNLGRSQMSWSGLLDVLSINDSSSKTGQSLLSRNLDMFEAEQVMYAGVAQDGENISTRLEKALSGSANKAISVNRYINKELDKEITIEWTGNENLNNPGLKPKPFMIRKTFTKDKLIDIYMKSKDKDTLEIMNYDEIHQYNDEFLAKVEAELTEDDIAVANALFDFYNDNYDRFNKFYEDHFGISLAHNKYYSPRSVTTTGIDVKDGSPRAYASFSGAKQRTAGKGSTINIKGAFAALNQYVQDLNHYIGYADKLQDINAVMGNKDIKEIIANVFGGGMNARIQYEIENMANSGTRAKGSSRFWNKVRSNYARSVLSVKPSLAIKQLTSFPAYWENMSTVDFIGGVADFFKHPKEAMKILGNTTLMKTRGTNIIRDFEVMSKTDTFKNMKKSAGKIKWNDLLMANIKFGDRGAIYIGGWALYRAELKKNLAAGMSEADAKAAALNRFERVTDETQQSGRLSQQSYMQSNSMLRAFTMFTSSQNQYLRKEINAIRGLVSGRMDKKQVAKTIFIYHFLLPMFFQAVSDGFRWDKDAQLRTAALGSLNGWFILNKVLENIYNKITGQASMFKANMTVRELVPFFGSLEDIYKDIEKLLDGDIEAEDVIKSVKTIGELTGLPLKYATDVALHAGDYAEEGEYGKEGLLWLGWSPYSLRDFAE